MAEYDGKVDMAKVDVDDVPDAAMKYNVKQIYSIYMLFFFYFSISYGYKFVQ